MPIGIFLCIIIYKVVRKVEGLINKVLLNIGIPAHLKGYQYLVYSIELLRISNHLKITKDVYPMVAIKYENKPANIERAIRNAIEIGWNRGNVEIYEEIFGYTVCEYKGKPTNNQFLTTLIEWLKSNAMI